MSTPSNSSPVASPAKVLVVEDEAIISTDLISHLSYLGFQVVDAVTTGLGAIAAAIAHCPDLVLMDIHLHGEMDGITAAAKIRETMDIPIVFLTASADSTHLQRAKTVSSDGFLIKPFEHYELGATLERALLRDRTKGITPKLSVQLRG
jgi:CheY-like chemotaxis protein